MNRLTLIFVTAAFVASLLGAHSRAEGRPNVAGILESGQLVDGARQLQAHLIDNPRDDKARFGLGVIQFLQTFEHFGADLHKYGLRTERFSRRPSRNIRQRFPQNPNPKQIAYSDVRRTLTTAVKDLMLAESTLAKIKDPKVKLPVTPAKIKLDVFGQGKPISASFLLPRAADEVVIHFDRGDVAWLRGYCHFMAAWGELALAVDGKELFECTAHLFFEKVDTPHRFLLEKRKPIEVLPSLEKPRDDQRLDHRTSPFTSFSTCRTQTHEQSACSSASHD